MLRLLQQGQCPMLEYETLRLLFEFLTILKNSKKHWTNNVGWQMAKSMH